MNKSEEIIDFCTDNIRSIVAGTKKQAPRIIFNWIPKNAGTSIYKTFRPSGMIKCKYNWQIKYALPSRLITFGHFDLRTVYKNNDRYSEMIKNSDIVSILRDPVTRFASIYSHYERHGTFEKYVKKPSMEQVLNLIEDGFIPKIGYYHHHDLSMFNPQSEWIDLSLNNTFLQFESLNSSILSEVFGRECRLLSRNVGNGNQKVKFSPEIVARIQYLYRCDYELINRVKFTN